MCDGCSESAENIIVQKFSAAPDIFHGCAEHPEGKHIEEDVPEIPVHEHIGEKLPPPEFFRFEIMQSEQVPQVNTTLVKDESGEKKNSIDDKKVLNDFRKKGESPWAELF